MPRDISITRQEAEAMVDQLEKADPDSSDAYYCLSVAAEIRQRFGMITREEEAQNDRAREKQIFPK